MKALTDYMEATGLSQQELAKRIGCNVTQLNHWINGRRSPSAENLKAIWHKTGISPEKLLSSV